jgi:hypothetical protein
VKTAQSVKLSIQEMSLFATALQIKSKTQEVNVSAKAQMISNQEQTLHLHAHHAHSHKFLIKEIKLNATVQHHKPKKKVNVHAQLVKSLIHKMEANAFQSVIQ